VAETKILNFKFQRQRFDRESYTQRSTSEKFGTLTQTQTQTRRRALPGEALFVFRIELDPSEKVTVATQSGKTLTSTLISSIAAVGGIISSFMVVVKTALPYWLKREFEATVTKNLFTYRAYANLNKQ